MGGVQVDLTEVFVLARKVETSIQRCVARCLTKIEIVAESAAWANVAPGVKTQVASPATLTGASL